MTPTRYSFPLIGFICHGLNKPALSYFVQPCRRIQPRPMEQAADPLVSVVIPVYNECDNIEPLAQEIADAFGPTDYTWEAVWVDDCSNDGSREKLRDLPSPHRALLLEKNCGQSAALMVGFRGASGTWVGTLDGDRQNDPADLPKQLTKALDTGVDMVNGIRAKRNDNGIRKLSSKIGNGTRNWLTGESVTDVGCSTRVVKREALVHLPFFHGMHRFLPTLVRMRGYSIDEMPVNHRERVAGVSKYGVWNRLWAGLRDIFGVRWLQSRNRVWSYEEIAGQKTVNVNPDFDKIAPQKDES